MGLKRTADESFFLVQPKFLKLDEELRKGLESVHEELSTLEQGCREEQIEVQCKYDALKRKHFDSRSELVKKIPDFWANVLLNFGVPAALIHQAEVEVINYVEDVMLEDNLDKKGSHKFTFTFKENPYFKETTVVKEIKVEDEDNVHITVTPLTFTKNPLAELDEEEKSLPSFLGWLQSTEEDGEDDFGSTFREHGWEEAVSIFSRPEGQDDEEDDDEDEDDDDEEGEEEGDEEGDEEGADEKE